MRQVYEFKLATLLSTLRYDNTHLYVAAIDPTATEGYESSGEWFVFPEVHRVEFEWSHEVLDAQKLKALQQKRTELMAAYQNKLTDIDRQIFKLSAIENSVSKGV